VKTNELISMLSSQVDPVDTQEVVRNVRIAILIGAAASLLVVVFILGVRTDLDELHAQVFLVAKLAFSLSVVILASHYLVKYIRPGGEFRVRFALTVLPFLAAMIIAAINLATAPRSHWETMVFGSYWLECLIAVPTVAVVPFATIMAAVRLAAPTDLVRTGALAGLVAGGVSATAYALHCMDDLLPFIALWYGGTIVLCTVAGAVLGPKLLRW
jgi:hypothetical protein